MKSTCAPNVVRHRGQAVRLTPKEFDRFAFMAKHPNRVLPHKTCGARRRRISPSRCESSSDSWVRNLSRIRGRILATASPNRESADRFDPTRLMP